MIKPITPPVPQTNPSVLIHRLRPQVDEAIARVLDSGRYILGVEVEEFEAEWAQWCGVKYAVGCANGTDGLELILRALDLPYGSRVLVPSHTAVATISAVVRSGCRPFFADIDTLSFTLDDSSVARCLEAASAEGDPISCLIAVHLYGRSCDLDSLQELCRCHSIPLIEDSSQAHGARWRGKRVGGFGVASAFSLYPTKNLGALGDAGVVTTQDLKLANRIRQLRQYGWEKPAISEESGINSRMDPLQAAILRVKLPYLEEHNLLRQSIALVYFQILAGCKDVELPLMSDSFCESVFHQFVIKLPVLRRDLVKSQLSELGIGTLIHYPLPAHQMPAYYNKDWIGIDPLGLPGTESLVPSILSLPMGPHLSEQLAAQVAERLTAVMKI